MTVGQLIELLKTFNPDMPVCYRFCSDYSMLEPKELSIIKLQKPRADGYVGGERPDKEIIDYLAFPGN